MICKECDLVVLGGGGSGMTAAVRFAQLTGKKTIVVEKTRQTGGGMLFASTMRTFGSRWQTERGLPDVTAAYLRKVMDATHWRLNPRLAGSAIRATGAFFDWFCDLAGSAAADKFRVGRYVFDGEDGPLGPQMGGPGGVTGGGRLFMDTLRAKCDELGVEVLCGYQAYDGQATDGKITTIFARGPEEELQIKAGACVLATGSWINNETVMREICPQFLEARRSMTPSPHTNPAYTGDGFHIAARVDAKLDRDNYCLRLMGPMVFSKSGVFAHMTNSPFTLAVNRDGKRYNCEPSQIRNGVFLSGLHMMEQPGGYAYIVFDTNNLEAAIRDCVEHPQPPAPGIFGLPDFPQTLEEALADLAAALPREEKQLFAADTVEELARLAGIDPVGLVQTVERYNRFCAQDFDEDCFKEPEHLVPCAKGPYYAVKASLGTDGAFGGVLVNGDMQALREDGSLIEGLYVTGDFASGRFLNLGGEKVQLLNDMSWALASGFLAGSHAAQALS